MTFLSYEVDGRAGWTSGSREPPLSASQHRHGRGWGGGEMGFTAVRSTARSSGAAGANGGTGQSLSPSRQLQTDWIRCLESECQLTEDVKVGFPMSSSFFRPLPLCFLCPVAFVSYIYWFSWCLPVTLLVRRISFNHIVCCALLYPRYLHSFPICSCTTR